MNDDIRPYTASLGLHLTLAFVVAAMADIAARFPSRTGNRDGGCVYVSEVIGHRLVPSCIVGLFFSEIGLLRLLLETPGDLDNHSFNRSPNTCNLGGIAEETVDRLRVFGVTLDREALDFLTVAQREQDKGSEWSVAVEAAAKSILVMRGEPSSALALLKIHTEVEDEGW